MLCRGEHGICYKEVSTDARTLHGRTNFRMVYLTMASDYLEQQVFGTIVG